MTPGVVDPPGPHLADEPGGGDGGSAAPPPTTVDVVLSGERARATRVTLPVERVRLRKVVVSREETVTVTVRREELRVVREDVVPGEAVHPGSTATPFEIVLCEERLVVDRTVVPVERVHVTVDEVVEDVDVSTTLRHERVDVTREPAAPPL
ncbi:YsnF/AvaK domain-containing protein [Frigoribacterium sp. PhB24]|uniref:YsnF/AvaK domain-containing protein n=1 Tax=Frigoribacterium sp. PhB24 TaxID=2485204 RepID=UPI000F47CB83|nr:DUF2382 domain-containing protein [Frigoribacterium sp. PhB24]ROS52622.1 uncharacterized protein (TIGR02271 family) [Frigoribacterium sp. PhB24]